MIAALHTVLRASIICEGPYTDAKNLAPTFDNDDNWPQDPWGRGNCFLGLFFHDDK
jgi:hypothetical protein